MYYLGITISFIVKNITLILFFLGCAVALAGILRSSGSINALTILDKLIAWYAFFSIGIHHLYSAFFLIFFGKLSADAAGWVFSPFTTEVGFANLSFSIAGFIAFKASRQFQNAVVLVTGFFLVGAFTGHLYQIACTGSMTHKSSAGIFILTDLFLPAVSFSMIYLRNRICRSSR